MEGKTEKNPKKVCRLKKNAYLCTAKTVESATDFAVDFSLKNSGDFFRKIVITDGNAKPWVDDDGIMYVGIIPFLLEEDL